MAASTARRRLTRALARAVRLACPRCGRAPLFRGWFTMNAVCAVCDLRFERAPGYWIGAIYVNYAATSVLAIGGFLALWRLADPPVWAQLVIWVVFVTMFPLWFFRYSRSLWLAVEYGLNPEP